MEYHEVAFSVEVVPAATGRGVLVTPRGELDMATQGELRAELERARSTGEVTLDLGELRFLDTSGLRLVLETAELARNDGFRFAVLPGGPSVQRLFEVAGVMELVPFVDPA